MQFEDGRMSEFTHLAQQAYVHHHATPSQRSLQQSEWSLKETLAAIMPFLQEHQGNLDAMPGLREALLRATPQEMQAMWTEYCHLGDLLYKLDQELHK
jgi:hypothetical protein